MGPTTVRPVSIAWAVGTAAAIFCAMAAGRSPVYAVDLANRDRVAREVVINRADGSSDVLTIKARQKVADVCSDCVILAGNSSVEVKGFVTVKIEDGKVSISSQR